MIKLVYAPSDAALAERIQADLNAVPNPDNKNVLVALLSPAANADSRVQQTIIDALDASQQIIPVLAAPTELPKLINHLEALDFSSGYNAEALQTAVTAALSPHARLPLKVHTPKVQAANRRVGLLLLILAIIWFVLALIFVPLGVQAPAEEYNNVDTVEAATIQFYLQRNMPHSTAEAENFPVTVQAAPRPQRPLLIATATEQALRR